MKWLNILLLATLLLIYSSPDSHAVGISGPHKPRYIFDPGLEINLSYKVLNSAGSALNISLSLETDASYCCAEAVPEDSEILAKRATIIPSSIIAEPGQEVPFKMSIKFPDEMKVPGLHAYLLKATESFPGGGGVAAATAVRTPIFLFVRFPGKHLDAELESPDVEIGKMQTFFITAVSRGTLDISRLFATINILDAHNKTIATVDTDKSPLPIDETKILTATWNTTDQSEGIYNVVATVDYDGQTVMAYDTFRIGLLNLAITNYTRDVFARNINPFSVVVASSWNNVISNVYAVINVKKDNQLLTTFQTPTTEVPPWTTKSIDGFFNTNLEPGIYDMDIILHFEDKTSLIQDKLVVTSKGFSITEFIFPITIFLILVIVNGALWLFVWKKRQNPPNSGAGNTDAGTKEG